MQDPTFGKLRKAIPATVVALELVGLLALGAWALDKEFSRFSCSSYLVRDTQFIVCSRPAADARQ